MSPLQAKISRTLLSEVSPQFFDAFQEEYNYYKAHASNPQAVLNLGYYANYNERQFILQELVENNLKLNLDLLKKTIELYQDLFPIRRGVLSAEDVKYNLDVLSAIKPRHEMPKVTHSIWLINLQDQSKELPGKTHDIRNLYSAYLGEEGVWQSLDKIHNIDHEHGGYRKTLCNLHNGFVGQNGEPPLHIIWTTITRNQLEKLDIPNMQKLAGLRKTDFPLPVCALINVHDMTVINQDVLNESHIKVPQSVLDALPILKNNYIEFKVDEVNAYNYAQASDIWRSLIMNEIGGFYGDFDAFCGPFQKNGFPTLLDLSKVFDVTIGKCTATQPHDVNWVESSCFITMPHSPFIEILCSLIKRNFDVGKFTPVYLKLSQANLGSKILSETGPMAASIALQLAKALSTMVLEAKKTSLSVESVIGNLTNDAVTGFAEDVLTKLYHMSNEALSAKTLYLPSAALVAYNTNEFELNELNDLGFSRYGMHGAHGDWHSDFSSGAVLKAELY